MNLMYALLWTVIFGISGNYLTSANSIILNVIGYGAWLMCGLSLLTFFKSIGR